MGSLYDLTGIVPGSSESEASNSPDAFDVSMDEDVLPRTPPPKKSILRQAGALTPASPFSPRKRVKFARKSISLNLGKACSPAYDDREFIAKEDRANVTFCLEKSEEALKLESPLSTLPVHGESSSIPSSSPQPVKPTFEISKYITMLAISSPNRKSFSTTALNKLGLQSTPINRCGSPSEAGGQGSRHLLRTPQAQNI